MHADGSVPTDPHARSFLRTNMGLIYLAAALAVPSYILSVLVGLNPAFTTVLLLLFVGVVWLLQRRQSRSNPEYLRNSLGSVTGTGAVAAVAVFALIQAVPYGRSHHNGAIVAEPAWPQDQTRSLVVRACFDCHSNEVKYPWYSNVAPVSWILSQHVSDGRAAVNFSNLAVGGEGAGNVIETIRDGSMPPGYFTRFGLHGQAKLSKAEIATVIAGLRQMPEFQERSSG